jgi:hypothetical protein
MWIHLSLKNSVCFGFLFSSDNFWTVYAACDDLQVYVVRIILLKTFVIFIFYVFGTIHMRRLCQIITIYYNSIDV